MASLQQVHNKRSGRKALRLVGARTLVRPVEAADLPKLLQWDADPEIIALMGRKYDMQAPEDWFESVQSDPNSRAMVIETLEGRLIGEVELVHLNRREGSAELRICVGEKDCWNHGYGSDALQLAITLGFEHLHLQTIYLRVFQTNHRAVYVYERLGFRKQAVLQPSVRRDDPAPVILMRLARRRWHVRSVNPA